MGHVHPNQVPIRVASSLHHQSPDGHDDGVVFGHFVHFVEHLNIGFEAAFGEKATFIVPVLGDLRALLGAHGVATPIGAYGRVGLQDSVTPEAYGLCTI